MRPTSAGRCVRGGDLRRPRRPATSGNPARAGDRPEAAARRSALALPDRRAGAAPQHDAADPSSSGPPAAPCAWPSPRPCAATASPPRSIYYLADSVAGGPPAAFVVLDECRWLAAQVGGASDEFRRSSTRPCSPQGDMAGILHTAGPGDAAAQARRNPAAESASASSSSCSAAASAPSSGTCSGSTATVTVSDPA